MKQRVEKLIKEVQPLKMRIHETEQQLAYCTSSELAEYLESDLVSLNIELEQLESCL